MSKPIFLTEEGLAALEQELEDLKSVKRKEIAEKITGVPKKVELGNRVVANVLYRDGTLLDTIKNTFCIYFTETI